MTIKCGAIYRLDTEIFVLYDPPVRANTWILWFGPPLLLLAGILVLRRIGSRVTRVSLSDEERARLEAIRKQ